MVLPGHCWKWRQRSWQKWDSYPTARDCSRYSWGHTAARESNGTGPRHPLDRGAARCSPPSRKNWQLQPEAAAAAAPSLGQPGLRHVSGNNIMRPRRMSTGGGSPKADVEKEGRPN